MMFFIVSQLLKSLIGMIVDSDIFYTNSALVNPIINWLNWDILILAAKPSLKEISTLVIRKTMKHHICFSIIIIMIIILLSQSKPYYMSNFSYSFWYCQIITVMFPAYKLHKNHNCCLTVVNNKIF
jgi:hypothetical protein